MGRTFVKWTFDADLSADPAIVPPFMDSCTDLGVAKVAVDVVDATGTTVSLSDTCGSGQIAFFGLPDGQYTVFLMPLDSAGTPLLAAPAQSTVTAGYVGHDETVTVPVSWKSWTVPYTGTFLFWTKWGGMFCDQVMPNAITKQEVTLTVNGVVQNVMTDDGQMLNGMDKKPCKKSTEQFPQSAVNVPFGVATIEIKGYDASDAMMFTKSFDTFVGAGISNPTLTFDVPLQ